MKMYPDICACSVNARTARQVQVIGLSVDSGDRDSRDSFCSKALSGVISEVPPSPCLFNDGCHLNQQKRLITLFSCVMRCACLTWRHRVLMPFVVRCIGTHTTCGGQVSVYRQPVKASWRFGMEVQPGVYLSARGTHW